MERKKGNVTYRVDVEVDGKNQKIKRKKSGASGAFRKKAKEKLVALAA